MESQNYYINIKRCENERSGDNLSLNDFNVNLMKIEHYYCNVVRSEISGTIIFFTRSYGAHAIFKGDDLL